MLHICSMCVCCCSMQIYFRKLDPPLGAYVKRNNEKSRTSLYLALLEALSIQTLTSLNLKADFSSSGFAKSMFQALPQHCTCITDTTAARLQFLFEIQIGILSTALSPYSLHFKYHVTNHTESLLNNIDFFHRKLYVNLWALSMSHMCYSQSQMLCAINFFLLIK